MVEDLGHEADGAARRASGALDRIALGAELGKVDGDEFPGKGATYRFGRGVEDAAHVVLDLDTVGGRDVQHAHAVFAGQPAQLFGGLSVDRPSQDPRVKHPAVGAAGVGRRIVALDEPSRVGVIGPDHRQGGREGDVEVSHRGRDGVEVDPVAPADLGDQGQLAGDLHDSLEGSGFVLEGALNVAVQQVAVFGAGARQDPPTRKKTLLRHEPVEAFGPGVAVFFGFGTGYDRRNSPKDVFGSTFSW